MLALSAPGLPPCLGGPAPGAGPANHPGSCLQAGRGCYCQNVMVMMMVVVATTMVTMMQLCSPFQLPAAGSGPPGADTAVQIVQ
jgi:hypothetical protein